ncbi:nuclear transport factor 2 family protein [Flavivirga eckloniae]|uniref:Isomerase n=1 Tax=Flavivirga eckloniae TaxID=1803846 RepID=A0A2K9PL41_9FLAO|nr:nuclear transport factor 2 family protein [Flavivirga eckloniae]AUP77784.1 isomerase [Flavivirga eckloniae]
MSDQIKNQAEQTFKNHLSCLTEGRITDWINLFAENAVMEVPYSPKAFPNRIEGREGLYEYMKDIPKLFKIEYKNIHFHPTAEPNLVIVEFECTGKVLTTNKPYDQKYISVITLNNDGKIVKYVDYWNPVVALEALGMG